jgi:hypothetical protein
MLHPDMSPEVKDLLGDGILKPVGKRQGHDHSANADHRRRDRQPDDESGEGPFPVEGEAAGYKGWDVHVIFVRKMRFGKKFAHFPQCANVLERTEGPFGGKNKGCVLNGKIFVLILCL